MSVDEKGTATMLRAAGLRATLPRLAVLAALADCAPHADTKKIAAAVRARAGAVSMQTVYNVVGDFVRAGIIRRIEPAGGPRLYELRAGDNHHHVVCRRCGAAADVPCVIGAAPCLDPSQTGGFCIDEAEITFWGLCPACQGDERH